MTVVSISTRRRAPRIALALLAALAALAALALALGAVAAVTLVALVALVTLTPLLVGRRAARYRAQAARPAATGQIAVALDDGALHQAIVVPVEQSDGRRLVLTAAGYMLLDAEGQVIYRL